MEEVLALVMNVGLGIELLDRVEQDGVAGANSIDLLEAKALGVVVVEGELPSM